MSDTSDSASGLAKRVINKVGLWWPDARESHLRQAAGAWEVLAGDLDRIAARGTAATLRLTTDNRGEAVDCLAGFWASYDDMHAGGYLAVTATACRGMARSLHEYAEAVHQAKRRIQQLAVTIGATLVAGAALAWFTFGATMAAAGAVTAQLVAAAAVVGVELSGAVASIVATALVGAAFGAAEAFAVDVAVAQPIRVYGFGDGGFSLDEAGEWVRSGAIAGAVLGPLLPGNVLRAEAAAGLAGAPHVAAGVVVRSVGAAEDEAAVFGEMSRRTMSVGREHALVELESGERVLLAGGHSGVELGPINGSPVRRFIAHSHPWDEPSAGASFEDYLVADSLGQESSVLLERGEVREFFTDEPAFLFAKRALQKAERAQGTPHD